MKKLFSLMLALVLCMSLTVPALADSFAVSVIDSNGTEYGDDFLPSGVEYDSATKTATLNGLNAPGSCLYVWRLENIVLAEGSKNTVSYVDFVNGFFPTLTIKGSGELIVSGTYKTNGMDVSGGLYSNVNKPENKFVLGEGMTITGGPKEGDSYPLKVNEKDGYFVTESGEKANYIRFGPAAGTPAPAPETPAAPAVNFTDVAANSPFKAAIDWAVEKNITKGITATTFGPGNQCTISHILTFLYRASGVTGTLPTEKENVADWAVKLGAPGGGWGAPCNRVMAVEFIWRAAGCPEPAKTVSFTDLADIPADSPSGKAISWAVEKGITTGTSATTFSPADHCTRGQIVTFLYRASQSGVL